MKFFYKKFYWIGGVHYYDILSQLDDNSINKAWRNSVAVLIASFLAFIGMFMTLTLIIKVNVTLALIGSAFWALIIFLIDRTIITNKSSNKLSWNVIIRIAMVILTSAIVMTSIELVVFKSAIDEYMNDKLLKKNNKTIITIQHDNLQVTEWKNIIKDLKQERNTINSELIKQRKALRMENFGESKSGITGYGPIAKSIQKSIDQLEEEKKYIQTQIDTYIQKIDNEINKEKTKNEKINTDKSLANRIDKQIEALYNLDGIILNITKWLIAALLMFIELTPVINKLTDKTKSKYDTFFDDVVQSKQIKIELNNINN